MTEDYFWGTLNIRCRSIVGIQKGTIILTTTNILTLFRQWSKRVRLCFSGLVLGLLDRGLRGQSSRGGGGATDF